MNDKVRKNRKFIKPRPCIPLVKPVKLFTVKEIMALSGVMQQTVDEAIQKGIIERVYKRRNKFVVPESEVERYLELYAP